MHNIVNTFFKITFTVFIIDRVSRYQKNSNGIFSNHNTFKEVKIEFNLVSGITCMHRHSDTV